MTFYKRIAMIILYHILPQNSSIPHIFLQIFQKVSLTFLIRLLKEIEKYENILREGTMTIGEKIKNARELRGLTLNELGIRLGFDEKSADVTFLDL